MAKKKSDNVALAAPPDIDVAATDEDLLQLTSGGTAIATFFSGLAAWFGVQREWEKKAAARLMAAKAIPAPKDKASDEVVQRFILGTTVMEKDYGEHSTVKGLLWKLHKRAVAIDNRAADPFSEAKAIATRLHNTYVQDEQRRVAAENERLRLAAEAKAREDRDAELAKLEADRLKAEATSDRLSERESAFVAAYFEGPRRGNATEAARLAGFKDPFASGARLLASEKVRAALDGKRQAQVISEQAAAVKEQPLAIGTVEEVKADVAKAGTDRTTWGGEVIDAAATIEAFRSGRFGIPGDLFQINPAKLNEYGRALHERLDLWPGVRHTKKTGLV